MPSNARTYHESFSPSARANPYRSRRTRLPLIATDEAIREIGRMYMIVRVGIVRAVGLFYIIVP